MQGENGSAASGKMAAVGMIWNAEKSGQVRYVCGMTGGLQALSGPLRAQGAQVGMDKADRWVAISDGGSGIEDWLRDSFPRVAAVILDFFHAAEHLSDWAKALHTGDESQVSLVISQWCHRLKHVRWCGGVGGSGETRRVEAFGVGSGGPPRVAGVLPQSGSPNGLPELSGKGLDDRQRSGGGRLQTSGGSADEGQWDALG